MIVLIVSIFISWLLLKMLWPRSPLYIEPPPLQIVIHISAQVLVQTRETGR